jgi:hypothetical protein
LWNINFRHWLRLLLWLLLCKSCNRWGFLLVRGCDRNFCFSLILFFVRLYNFFFLPYREGELGVEREYAANDSERCKEDRTEGECKEVEEWFCNQCPCNAALVNEY